MARLIAGEQKLFETRRSARQGQKAQLKERVGQLQEQISGPQRSDRGQEARDCADRRGAEGRARALAEEPGSDHRVTALERDAARLEGERGSLVSSIAQTKGKITETELQILQIDQDLRTEVGKELAEIRGKVSELVEKRVAAEDQLKRIDIRAPQDGTVHQLSVHTVGGVITPNGEPLMLIVPKADALTVEARIAPQEIDRVHVGQRAVLRFSAFNQRTTPELNGAVSVVSADISTDPKTGASFYTVRIAISGAELARLGGLKLVPGMPVESFIQTEQRTVLSYLTKPLTDQALKAFRER